jgi:hypothetical protein
MKLSLPNIMVANTFFWQPASTATQRKQNEIQRTSEVEIFLTKLGFNINRKDNMVKAKHDNGLEVYFSYVETHDHVWKKIYVWKNEQRVTIKELKNFLNNKSIFN